MNWMKVAIKQWSGKRTSENQRNLSKSEDRRFSGFLKMCCHGTSTNCFFGKNR